MDEKNLHHVNKITNTIVWGFVILFLMCLSGIFNYAMQRTSGAIGACVIIVLLISPFFIPYMIITKMIDGSKYQDEKKYKYPKDGGKP